MLELFFGDFGAQDTIHFIEEKLRIGFWLWNLRTDAMEWSEGIHHLLGLRMGSVQPHFALLANMIHADDRRLTKTGLTRSDAKFAKGDTFRLILKNGRVRWIKCKSEVLARASGGARQAIGVMQDVTELQEELIRLRLDSGRLHALSTLLATPVWTADGTTGEVVDIIHNWKRLGAETAKAFLGEHWIDFVHPDDRGETRKAWQAARSHNALYEAEHRLRDDDGVYRWKRSKAVPIKTANGPEYVGITVDIHNAKTAPQVADGRRITGAQIRAARGILRWSVRDLADRTKISIATIRRLEENDKTIHDDAAPRLFQVLSAAGVEFFAVAPGKLGVGPR